MKRYNLILKRMLLSFLFLILVNPAFSQDTLTLEETFSIAIKENLDVKISANNKKKLSNEISKLINTINNCKNENELLKYYNSTSELKKTWGSVLHYVALIKS